ncbi:MULTISPECIES: hypothetical protein [Bradyrhizobium]|uniref:hypothetical protein n=1 Tax=Bradyrhizobium TaxID=374 RepID=UPI00155E0C6A|nr:MULTISPECIES: hypothetical protein [Bradyrhizobium]MBR1171120.1 hypothetical protein [Bradyrhizobium liaoningense]UUO25877.1 hypothetical protein DCG74_00435 [Bradyrhizobium sp. WBAH42]
MAGDFQAAGKASPPSIAAEQIEAHNLLAHERASVGSTPRLHVRDGMGLVWKQRCLQQLTHPPMLLQS